MAQPDSDPKETDSLSTEEDSVSSGHSEMNSQGEGARLATGLRRFRNLIGVLLVGVVSGVFVCETDSPPEESVGNNATDSVGEADPLQCVDPTPHPDPYERLTEDEKNTIEVSKKILPSLVYIEKGAHVGGRGVLSGSGSGFVWDKEGHVVTNAHVVRGGDEIEVSFSWDQCEKYRAKVVGIDEGADLAVIRVEMEKDKLVPVEVPESTELLMGQKVIVVGSPYGFRQTLSTGVISSLARVSRFQNNTVAGMIQTDAMITNGNSGGPVVDSRGRLIGVSDMMIKPPESIGATLGFAIPIREVKFVVPQLIEKGRVARAGLGIYYKDIRAVKGVAGCGGDGIMIDGVVTSRAANKAGLRAGDVLLAINTEKVEDDDTLSIALNKFKPGDTVIVELLRGEEKMELPVILDERP